MATITIMISVKNSREAPASWRARSRSLAPSAREVMAVPAMDRPMPIEMVKKISVPA